jgi:hypothetical protein
MLRRSIIAAAVIVSSGGTTRAQIVAGDSPNRWNAAWAYGVARSHDPETVWRRQEEERAYQAALKTIPSKKPSNDPWKNVRATQPEADRHRAQ